MLFERIELPKVRTVWALGAGLNALLCLSMAGAAQAAPARNAAEVRLREAWRAAISDTALPGLGCFTATYPSATWTQVACISAPNRLYGPAHRPVVGGGFDYAAGVSGSITTAVGSFPSITGLKSEKNNDISNQYSLQLNTQDFTTTACDGSQYPPECSGWQQFVFAQSGGKNPAASAFMVYWLINYGPVCPSGWNQAALNCWINGSAVSVPVQALSALSDLQLSGSVVSGGDDTLQLTTSSEAYSVSGSDSMLNLAGAWTQTEYNIFGNGGGSEADFNKRTDITVEIQLTDGLTTAPACKSDTIFTYETNDLNLGKCTGQSGETPSITYTESGRTTR
jgi:hypothetical protein